MAINIKKVKNIVEMAKKLRKYSPLNISKWNKAYYKETYTLPTEGNTTGGKYKTPDGKNFKGKYSLNSKLTKSKIPTKLKGKFSKKPSKLKNRTVLKSKQSGTTAEKTPYVNPNRVLKGEQGSGGGGGHEGPL